MSKHMSYNDSIQIAKNMIKNEEKAHREKLQNVKDMMMDKDITYYEMLRREQGVNHRLTMPADKAAEVSRMEIQLQYLKNPENIGNSKGMKVWLIATIIMFVLAFFDNPIGDLSNLWKEYLVSPILDWLGEGFINRLSGFIAGFFLDIIAFPSLLGLVIYLPWYFFIVRTIRTRRRHKFIKMTEDIQNRYDALLEKQRR